MQFRTCLEKCRHYFTCKIERCQIPSPLLEAFEDKSSSFETPSFDLFVFPYIISQRNVKPKCFYWFKSHLAAFAEIFRILWVCFWSKPVVKLRFSLEQVSHPVNSSSQVLPKRVPRTQDCEPGILIKLWHRCSLWP